MDITSAPSIRISHANHRISPSQRSPLPSSYSPPSSRPMSILPRAHGQSSPPPALPPPTNVEELGLIQARGWPFTNSNWQGFASVKPECNHSSDIPAAPGDGRDEDFPEVDPMRRGSSITTVTPATSNTRANLEAAHTLSEDDMSPSNRSPDYRLQGVRQLERKALDDSSRSYDRDLLSKIGGPNTPQRLSISSYTSAPDIASGVSSPGRSASVTRFSITERRRSSNDSRWSSNAGNPSLAPKSPGPFRSPLSAGDYPEFSRSIPHHPSSQTLDGRRSHRGSGDSGMMFLHEDFSTDDGHHDTSADGPQLGAHAGMKRRASSPQREITREDRSSVDSTAGTTDLWHRRSLQQLPNRSSPGPRYRQPQHGSVSSVSSAGHRTASLGSSLAISIASSATSLASGRLSPSNLSPAVDPDLIGPYSVNPSPRGSLSNTSVPRVFPEMTNDELQDSPEDYSAQTPAILSGRVACECCPKKPKRFDNEEDLRLHQMEKQYTCAFCPNRFKNKNEAERHQNSLHLRRQSWSCAAIPAAKDAFHASQTNGGLTDICGFCGEEFSNPPQWEHREEHLIGTHKFRDCNLSKKFFRADHFRQHLKHSHSGTSGKWTTMLETACMRMEPPPPTHSQPSINSASLATFPTNQNPMATAPPNVVRAGTDVHAGKPDVIDEVPHES